MLKRKKTITEVERKLCILRCFEDTLNSLFNKIIFPNPICYEPTESKFEICVMSSDNRNSIYLFDECFVNATGYENQIEKLKALNDNANYQIIKLSTLISLTSNNEVLVNSLGHWIQITAFTIQDSSRSVEKECITFDRPKWFLRYSLDPHVQVINISEIPSSSTKHRSNTAWLAYIENWYSLVKNAEEIETKFKPNHQLINEINSIPNDWTFEYDEELAKYLSDNLNIDSRGSVKNIVKMISFSSQRTVYDSEYLISSDKELYWESDSYIDTNNGNNAIRINFKTNTVIKKLFITVNKKDRQFMPKEVIVFGGATIDELFELNKTIISFSQDGDVLILENCNTPYDFIEIKIKSCQKGGHNCRVRGIKAFTQLDDNEYISNGIFDPKILHKTLSKIASFPTTFLYWRSRLLLRFIYLFDFCVDIMIPSWDYSGYFETKIQLIKELLVLSKRRSRIVDKLLRKLPYTSCCPPTLYINRQIAVHYSENATNETEYHKTVFMQIYKQLKTEPKSYNFRWDRDTEQWWECKFIGEGIIDQGGGFRDSLSNISEELCPPTALTDAASKPMPLPYFIRSPNQHQSDLSTYKDTFILNPSCHDFEKYEFIGKLMGACFRSRESLALYLAPFVWKKLSGETVSWSKDFVTVDAFEVKVLDSIGKMDEEEYNLKFSNEKTWCCILSDGSTYELKPNGTEQFVVYEDRLTYIELVKQARLNESDKQLAAVKTGLESVVSHHLIALLTCSEIEHRICGSPEISIEDLKMSIEYDDLCPNSNRVKYFWDAITNFTNDERIKFVRFVTGRKRLPVKIFFCSSDQPPTSFPDSSTCNCTIYFPNYPSGKVAEEKLKYAIYNCIAIDTDLTSYDDE